jgi:hypothetical protein
MYIEYANDTLGATRNPKSAEIKLSDGNILGRPAGGWQDRQLAACGLFPVANVARPNDTLTTTHTRTVELATPGDPTTATVVWNAVSFTQEELDMNAAAVVDTSATGIRHVRLTDIRDGVDLDTLEDVKQALRVVVRELIRDNRDGVPDVN